MKRLFLAFVTFAAVSLYMTGALFLPSTGPYGVSNRNPYADGFWHAGCVVQDTNTMTFFCNVTVSIPGSGLVMPTDGVSDCAPALQAAYNLCPSNGIIVMPAGQFLFKSSVTIPSYVHLYGQGSGVSGTNDPTATVCYNTQSNGPGTNIFPQLFAFGIGGNKSIIPTTNALAYGTNEIDVTTANWNIIVGEGLPNTFPYLGVIAQTNDFSIPLGMKGYAQEGGLYNGSNVTAQTCIITNAITNGSCVRLFSKTPFYYTYYLTNKPVFMPLAHIINGASIGNLEIAYKQTNPGSSLGPCELNNCLNCWVVNVHIYEPPSDGFSLLQCAMCDISTCWVENSRYNGSGRGYQYHIIGPSSDCMVENNIAQKARHSYIMESGGCGNVFAFNTALGDSSSQETSSTLTGDFINHAAGTYLCLYEGNYGHSAWNDFIHGTIWGMAYYRNWFTGGSQNPPDLVYGDTNYPAGFIVAFNRTAVYLSPTNWYCSFCDNIFGTPYFNNYSGATYSNSASTFGFTYIWMTGVDNNVSSPQTQTDPGAWNTMYQDGNLDYSTGPTGQRLWNTFPHAFDITAIAIYSNSIPSYFGYPTNKLIGWPALGADVTVSPYILPAMLRWYAANGITISVPLSQLTPVYNN